MAPDALLRYSGSDDGSKKAITNVSVVESVGVGDKQALPKSDSDDSDASDKDILNASKRATEERRLVRKLDMRLLPMIILIFIMNYIDIFNMTQSWPSSTHHTARLKFPQIWPSWYIGICVVLWGLTSAMTGLLTPIAPGQVTHNFAGIITCRVFIGLPEAAFYPGAIYLLSRWYTRKELAFRSALLYGGLLISNAFGSVSVLIDVFVLPDSLLLLSSPCAAVSCRDFVGYGRQKGNTGLEMVSMTYTFLGNFLLLPDSPWPTINQNKGAITILVGFLTIWVLPDYPNNTRWLSSAERRLAQVRLSEDAGEADQDREEDSMLAGFKMARQDIKVPIFSIMTAAQLLGLSFVNFFPTCVLLRSVTKLWTLGCSEWVVVSQLRSVLARRSACFLLRKAYLKRIQKNSTEFNPPIQTAVDILHYRLLLERLACRQVIFKMHKHLSYRFIENDCVDLPDKTGERFFHISVHWWLVIVAYIIGVSTFSIGGRYFAMFLMASGYAGECLTFRFALTLVWVSNTIPRPPAKRAAAIGIVNGFGNLGNLVGSYAWKVQWGPQYHQSMIIGICALAVSSVLSFFIRCILIRDNKRLDEDELVSLKGADRERVEEAARLEGISFEEAMERKRGFRYLY
ncbi:hypothetical protein EW145_g7814 [Phellinidium pouzarii]|uniref:Major facilitator superfamily (MFS) profile domain-containing protein n=1 Tax=Phellinidium pouzarii TaxID=167371 RepID=A0A4S4KI41_9AGAM|nr:hypothetical protein EW145_g7814 [Phellinidium pouzarii]